MPTFIADPNRTGHKTWNIKDLYSHSANGNYVPNIDDRVIDIENDLEYIVSEVDYVSGLSTIRIWNSNKVRDSIGITDYFTAAGPGPVEESFKILINFSKSPYLLNVDSRLTILGDTASYIKIFRHEDVSDTQGIVVSMYYPPGQDVPVDRIPLNINRPVSGNNPVVKVPSKAFCNQLLQDGEIATMAVYDDDDVILSTTRLSVFETTMVKEENQASKYITGISLESPMLSPTNDTVVEVPVNVTLDSLAFYGIVHYSDGSIQRLPVDGTKFDFIGFDDYIPDVIGKRNTLLLTYRLDPSEYLGEGVVNDNRIITESFIFTVIRGNERSPLDPTSFGVKLHAYPRYNPSTLIWEMQYYLISISRDMIYNVTSLVEIASGTFDGLTLGVMQRFIVTLDLEQVDDDVFSPYIHRQDIVVTLTNVGYAKNPPIWYIRESVSQFPPYGENTVARWDEEEDGLMIDIMATSASDWLEKLYYRTRPIYDPYRDLAPLEPTHFQLMRNLTEVLQEESVVGSSWQNEFDVSSLTLHPGELILVRFIRRESDADLILSIAGLPVVTIGEG